MKAATLAKLESLARPFSTRLPPRAVVRKYSEGRLDFLTKLGEETPSEFYSPPEEFSRELWGIRFRGPVMNAAGMFKNGECYEMTAKQGAAGYIGGTGTWNSRHGNEKDGIYLPFAPYARSHAASNWLGLPNDGDHANSERARTMKRVADCPIGWSVAGPPDLQGEEMLRRLVTGMRLYESAGVDFLEMNESCPNTGQGTPNYDELGTRLRYVKDNFLDIRTRRLPVIVKFSVDTELPQVPSLMDMLFELGFDGVNFGNTSTQYARRRATIHPDERKLYDFYTIGDFGVGGGVSGRPLKEDSLALAGRAVEYFKAGPPSQEFHVIRTGGVESWRDVEQSERAGVSLNQWYTGYFEMFAKHGHGVYRKLLAGAAR
ncbi:MAG: hypothetical protein HY516_01300 [Candidatus Aenigmarchaeota archaeon]|nr:hypothetical protein [Candidatus Aenigmarchaeota archaeon]